MRDENYESALAGDIAAFVAQKRACGYPYVASAAILRRFDRMVAERFPDDETLTKGACDAWLALVEDEHPNELLRRVSPVRQLAKYMTASGKPSYLIPSGIPGKRMKYQAHIFTEEELLAFFSAVDSCEPSACSPTKAYVVPTLFRMLYCCGMRSSEPLLLDAAGVDLDSGRIDIKGCKGWRGRTIYMGDDMLHVCRAYDAVISGMLPGRVPFFPNREGNFFSKHAPNRWFHQFWDSLPEAACVKGNPPRVHDFRHTYAVTRLNRWVAEDANVQAMYPYLSGFLGHANFADTNYYLKMSASFYPELDRRMAPINSLILPEVTRNDKE